VAAEGRPRLGGQCPARPPRFWAFFFQAEDGIRDFHVTGVQTCALPICWAPRFRLVAAMMFRPLSARALVPSSALLPSRRTTTGRSEERRVGKEGRRGWGGPASARRGGGRSGRRCWRSCAGSGDGGRGVT